MSRSVEVRIPLEQSEGTRSQILRWFKSVGDSVQEHEPLFEIETDKVTVEVASPATGIVREILRQEQDEIEAGETLARIELADVVSAALSEAVTARPVTAAPVRATSNAPASRRNSESLSPAVRRLLQERNLSAHDVVGTAAGGALTVDDVLNARPATSSHAPAALKSPPPIATPGAHLVPHTSIRKRIAEHMVHSLLQTAPHVTTVFEADFAAVLAHRARHRIEFEAQGVPLTLTAYIVLACVDAIRAVPEINARWHPESLELYEQIDIGVGTAVPDKGLIVPVVRAVQRLDLLGVARQLGELVSRAREDRLTPQDVRGGTFTISNHGVGGSLLAAPIVINQPQVAILGVGKVEKRAVVVEREGVEQIEARPRGYLTLTIDHRVLDGQRANRFLDVLVRYLEAWPDPSA